MCIITGKTGYVFGSQGSVYSCFKALFTWREGNHAGRVPLLEGLPSSIVFPGFVCMRGRVTPGGG